MGRATAEHFNHDVAHVLIAERDAVLREMPYVHGWSGAPRAAMEDALDGEIARLWNRPFNDADHVKASLRQSVKWAASKYFRSRPWRSEQPAGDDLERLAEEGCDDSERVDDALSVDPLLVHARDCLAELSEQQAQIVALAAEGQSERRIASALGLRRADVQAQRRIAEHKIAMFAVVVHAGRVCGKRASAIAAYADGVGTADEVRRARAHLGVCAECSAAFAQAKTALRAQVASLVPAPAVALAAGELRGGSVLGRLIDLITPRGGPIDAIRETAAGVFTRNPASAEAVTGAGLGGAGLAIGAKAVAGVCVAALATGGAVCSSLGVLPHGLNIHHPARGHAAPADRPHLRVAQRAAAAASAPTRSATTHAARLVAPAVPHAYRGATRHGAAASSSAVTNPLQSSQPTGAPIASAASVPPPSPPAQVRSALKPAKSTGVAAQALTGPSAGFENTVP